MQWCKSAGTARSDHGAVVAAAREGVVVAVAVAAVAGWLFVVRAAVVQRKDGQLSVSACLSSLRDFRACPRLVRPGGTVPQSQRYRQEPLRTACHCHAAQAPLTTP